MAAIFGQGTGYVPCPDAEEVSVNEAGTEMGRSTYFVPAPCDCAACSAEIFDRTVSGGWGVSEIDGLLWVPSWSPTFSVTPGSAQFAGDSTFRNMRLPFYYGAGATPFEALVEFTVPDGAAAYVNSIELDDDGGGFFNIDFSRDGSGALDLYFYGNHGDGGFWDGSLTGQLSGFGGVPIFCRLRVDQDMHFKVWLSTTSEPSPWTAELSLDGTASPLSLLILFFGTDSVPVSFQRVEVAEGYTCGGLIQGTGTAQYRYQVMAPDDFHSGDPQWTVVGQGRRLNVTYFGSPINGYSTYSLTVGTFPHWQRGHWFDQREWIPIPRGPGITRAKLDYNPNLGATGPFAVLPIQVGLFSSVPSIASVFSPIVLGSNIAPSFQPYSIVGDGEWFDLTQDHAVWASPLTLNGNEDLQGSGTSTVTWTGASPDDFIVTIEYYPDAEWVSCD
jgi:hypothetical protein